MKTKTFLFINTKDKTLIEFKCAMDGLGRATWSNRVDIIEHGKCAQYVNPWSYFMTSYADYIKENGDLVEVMENKWLKDAENSLFRLQSFANT